MRYWLNELNVIRIKDLKTLGELRDFVRYPNGTWAAKPGSDNWDDRVMSLIWALMSLENEITERYFEILELDDNKRPLKLKALDYGIKYFVNPISAYNNEKDQDMISPLPIIMQGDQDDKDNGIADLESQGWSFLNQGRQDGWHFLQ